MLFAQDSLDLQIDVLGKEDIFVSHEDLTRQKVLSASRTLKSVEELPFTIYVVTKEEIFKNGYTTLVDVLKTVPGIKVSQPGSALEGETFMMRGLFGNSYAKILVNDVEVKPSVVSGMPIGAQLPIKEAERIEIIFGPAAAVYGADASAGVINIITREIEQPIYAQADLSLGTDGYNHLNVMFGGKVGWDKNIIKFSVYGSNTEFANRNTLYDYETLYNPDSYYRQEDTTYVDNTNYRGGSGSPFINNIPHLSRLLGIELKYRAFGVSFMRMYRRDHSSIGLNTRSVSYADPRNYLGETINRFTFKFEKDFDYMGIRTDLSLLNYAMDERSSFTYVDVGLNQVFNSFLDSTNYNLSLRNLISNNNFERYFSGDRFTYASSTDIKGELLLTVHPDKDYELIFGANFRGSKNQPLISYLRNPYNPGEATDGFGNINFFEFPAFVADEFNLDVGAFFQTYVTLKKWNLIGGLRYDYFSRYGASWNPRIAALFKVSADFSLRGSFATAFRVPSPFYSAATYKVNLPEIDTSGMANEDKNVFTFTTGNDDIRPERTISYELGGRWNWKNKIIADVSVFFSETQNFISSGLLVDNNVPTPFPEISIGFFNDGNSEMFLYGCQTRFVFQKFIQRYDHVKAELTFNYAQGREILPFDAGEIDEVRLQPRFSGQFKISFNPLEKIYININNVFSSNWLKRFILNKTLLELEPDNFRARGFYTLDITTRWQIGVNFQAFVKVTNLFDEKYAGIDAIGSVDDLAFNPQPTRTYQVGLSYRMFQ